MKSRFLSPGLVLALLLATVLAAQPVSAGGFSVFASYLDLDEPDGAIGVGIRYDIALGSSWTLDLAVSIHEEASFDLDTDLVPVVVEEDVRFIPLDLGVRYHIGDSDGYSPYFGVGFSHLEIDTDLGEGDEVQGFYGLLGLSLGDDVGPKFFVEGTYRAYDDIELDLFPELDSDDRDDFPIDGFSAIAGVRWRFGR